MEAIWGTGLVGLSIGIAIRLILWLRKPRALTPEELAADPVECDNCGELMQPAMLCTLRDPCWRRRAVPKKYRVP